MLMPLHDEDAFKEYLWDDVEQHDRCVVSVDNKFRFKVVREDLAQLDVRFFLTTNGYGVSGIGVPLLGKPRLVFFEVGSCPDQVVNLAHMSMMIWLDK